MKQKGICPPCVCVCVFRFVSDVVKIVISTIPFHARRPAKGQNRYIIPPVPDAILPNTFCPLDPPCYGISIQCGAGFCINLQQNLTSFVRFYAIADCASTVPFVVHPDLSQYRRFVLRFRCSGYAPALHERIRWLVLPPVEQSMK